MLLCLAAVAAAYLLVLHEQVAGQPWLSEPDPIWTQSAASLGADAYPATSLVRGQPFFALGNPIACFSALALGLLIGVDRLRARRLLHVTAWSGLVYAAYGIISDLLQPTGLLWLERTDYIGDVLGTFVNRNTAASYFGCCTTIWLLLLGEAIGTARPTEAADWRSLGRLASRPPRRVVVPGAAAFVCLVALMMTSSRAGILISLAAMLGAGLTMAWKSLMLRASRPRLILGGGVATLVALEMLGGAVDNRFSTTGFSDENRIDIYRATLRIIADHPWFGTGLGTFAWVFPSYRAMPPALWGVWVMAHSTPLELAADLGVPLALLIGSAVLAAFIALWQGIRTRRRDTIFPLAGAAVTGIAVGHSCIDFSMQIPGFAIVVMALLGVGLSQSVPTRPAPGSC